jgi:hypothetical protein
MMVILIPCRFFLIQSDPGFCFRAREIHDEEPDEDNDGCSHEERSKQGGEAAPKEGNNLLGMTDTP